MSLLSGRLFVCPECNFEGEFEEFMQDDDETGICPECGHVGTSDEPFKRSERDPSIWD